MKERLERMWEATAIEDPLERVRHVKRVMTEITRRTKVMQAKRIRAERRKQ